MFTLVENLSQLKNITQGDALGTRIRSVYELYGNKLGTFVWADESLALCLKDGVATLCGKIQNRAELMEFLSLISPAAIMCDKRLSNELKFDIIQEGEVYGKNSSGVSVPLNPVNNIRLKDFYRLFVSCHMELEYESFCLDASLSFRRSGGTAVAVYENNELIAGAVSCSVTDSAAIINAVAVAESHRRMGLGAEVMEKIETALSGRSLFVFKEIGENDGFYSSLGYSLKGYWTVARLPSLTKL